MASVCDYEVMIGSNTCTLLRTQTALSLRNLTMSNNIMISQRYYITLQNKSWYRLATRPSDNAKGGSRPIRLLTINSCETDNVLGTKVLFQECTEDVRGGLIQGVVMGIMIALCNQTCALVSGMGTPFSNNMLHSIEGNKGSCT